MKSIIASIIIGVSASMAPAQAAEKCSYEYEVWNAFTSFHYVCRRSDNAYPFSFAYHALGIKEDGFLKCPTKAGVTIWRDHVHQIVKAGEAFDMDKVVELKSQPAMEKTLGAMLRLGCIPIQ